MQDILRDRRTLFATVIIPILLIPLMTFGIPLLFSSTEQQIVEQTQYIAIINYESSEEFTKLIDGSRSLRVVVIDKPIDEAIRNGTIAVGIEIPEVYRIFWSFKASKKAHRLLCNWSDYAENP